MTARGRKRVFFSLFFGLYCTVFASLLVWINALSPQPLPQINTVKLLSDNKTLQIKGNHLDQYVDAVLAPSINEEASIVAKKFTWGEAFDIKIVNGIAWVANHTKGLIGYNIDDPEHPYAISSLDFPGKTRVWSLALSGNVAVISASLHGIYLADLSDPSHPEIVSHLPLTGVTQCIAIKDQLALIASGTKGLHIVDLQDKKNPKILSNLDLDGYLHSVTWKGHLAFISGGIPKEEQGLTYVIDITNPEQPKKLKAFSHKGKVWHNRVVGHRLLCGTTDNVDVIDLTQPLQTQEPYSVISGISVTRLFDYQDRLYVISRYQRIYQYDLSDNFSHIKTYNAARRACRAMDIQGHYGFIASGAYGLSVIDLNSSGEYSNPSLSVKNLFQRKSPFYIKDDMIVIIDEDELKIGHSTTSNSTHLIEKTFALPGKVTAMLGKGNRIYLCIKNFGIYALDLEHHHDDEALKGLFPLDASVRSLAIHEGTLYICQIDGPILQVSLEHKPYKPELFIDEIARCLLFDNKVIYLAKDPNGLSVYRKADKTSAPTRIGAIDYPERLTQSNHTTDLFKIDNTLFFGSSKGLISIDVSLPEAPRILDSIELSEHCRTVQVVDNLAYVSHTLGGMSLVDIKDPHFLKELCSLPEIEKFFVEKKRIYTLDLIGNLHISQVPRHLDKDRIKDCMLNFHLPRPDAEGDFDLFLSDVNTTKSIKRTLSYTRKSGWTLNTSSANKQLHSEQSGGI
nr:hypothetical protein [uncultured Desulfuromonas sp.]